MSRRIVITALVVGLGSVATGGRASAQERDVPLEERVEALSEDVDGLRERAVQVPALADAVEALSEAVAALEQEVGVLRREQRSIPEAVAAYDELRARVRRARRDLELLRGRLADVEQPVIGGGGVAHDGGFHWEADGGEYALTLYGYAQTHYQVNADADLGDIEAATFLIRRARLGVRGRFGEDLTYNVLTELVRERPLLEGYLDYDLGHGIGVRAGQFKVPLSRSFAISARRLAFAERPRTVNGLRYGRDVGAAIGGRVLDGRLGFIAGAVNGTGPNVIDDNLDVAAFARASGLIFGEPFVDGVGDAGGDHPPSAEVGVSFVHDLVDLPDELAGIPVVDADVDGDGERDAVRVISAGVDAAFRHGDLQLLAEGLLRRESWGAILDDPDNADLADPIGGGREIYFAGYGQATYAVLPELLVAGVRVGRSEQPLLGLGGRRRAAPPPRSFLWELGASATFVRGDAWLAGVDYTFFDYDGDRTGPGEDRSHRLILRAQLNI